MYEANQNMETQEHFSCHKNIPYTSIDATCCSLRFLQKQWTKKLSLAYFLSGVTNFHPYFSALLSLLSPYRILLKSCFIISICVGILTATYHRSFYFQMQHLLFYTCISLFFTIIHLNTTSLYHLHL